MKKYKILFVLSGAAAGCSVHEKQKFQLPEKPNILIISCEDISPDLGCYGNKLVKTPNLDRLAAEGLRFTHAFTTAGVSAPSRCAMITGMYASSIGGNCMRTSAKNLPDGIPPYEAVPPADVKCYSELLRKAGYYCTNNEKTDYQFASPITAWDECSRQAHWRNRPKGKPFFAIFNIMTTHESQISYRKNSPLSYHDKDVNIPPYYPDDSIVRRDIARNLSNITVMDREAGMILRQLKDDGLYDSTIIIFYSDHGGPLPRQKREVVESGTHIPLIIRLPKAQLAGTVIDELVSMVDLPPTILSLAGIKKPSYMQGQIFLGPHKEKPREYVFAARDRMDTEYDMVRSVRDKKYLYVRNFHPELPYYQNIQFRINNIPMMKRLLELKEAGKLDSLQMIWFAPTKPAEQLYDVENDPHTLYDIAAKPENAAIVKRMRKVLDRWMKDINDQGLNKDGSLKTEKQLVWEMWPGGVQPVTEKPQISLKNNVATITCNTTGASIAYQINGKGLNEKHWFLYSAPVALNKGDTLTAVAIRIGYKQSEKSEIVYQ